MDGVSTWLIEFLPFWESLFNLLAALAWPIAAIAIARIFRTEIKNLFLRVTKVSFSGAEFGLSHQKSPEDSVEKKSLSQIETNELADPTMQRIESKNSKELATFQPEDREKILLRALTVAQLEKNFSIAYTSIFGSQIRALDLLNSRAVARVEAEELFKANSEGDTVLSSWTLDQYMNYLLAWEFVEYHDGTYKITETGRNFLRFLTNTGLSKERAH